MLYREEYLKSEWFDGGYAFHFCSVSLGDFPMKEAHRKAIAYAKEAGMLVSYGPESSSGNSGKVKRKWWQPSENLCRMRIF